MLQRKNTFQYSLSIVEQRVKADELTSPPSKNIHLLKIQHFFSDLVEGDINKTLISVIKELQCIQDIENNIISSFYFQNKDAFPVFFRDARKISPVPNTNPFYPFAVMGLQAMLAARKLAQIARVPDVDHRFRLQDAILFYNKISRNTESDNPEYDLALLIERIILPELADALSVSQEDALRRLHMAKDFANFEYPSTAVATLTSHLDANAKTVYVLHVDTPIVELNSSLIEEYQFRKQKHWYMALSLWQQQLIDEYLEPILEGRVIPTQLRKYLPGLRNAGEEKVFAFHVATGQIQEIYHSFHSGNLGHLTKGDNEALTGFALDQLVTAVGPETHLHLTSLTSPVTKRAKLDIESHLDDQVNRAADVRRANLTWGVVPLNPFRHFTIEHSKSSWMIQSVEKLLKAIIRLDVSVSSLTGEAFWGRDLLSLLSEPYKNNFYFKELIRVANSLRQTKIGSDREADGNRHLKLARNMALLAFYYEQCCYELNQPHFKPFAIDFFCKSGKDRTGLLDLMAVIYAVAKYLVREVDDNTAYRKMLDDVTRTLVSGQHVQRRAGEVGGTMGAEGFVPSLKFTLPERFSDKILQALILFKPARFNTKYPRLESITLGNRQQNRLYEDCEEALRSLELAAQQAHGDAKFFAERLSRKARYALEGGNVSLAAVPILTDLLTSSNNLIRHSDPASTDYRAELRRYTRATKEVVGHPQLGKIVGGIALCLLGVAMIATSIALGIPTGGLSLGGVVIGSSVLALGIGFMGGLCAFGGLFLALDGKKKGVARFSEQMLSI